MRELILHCFFEENLTIEEIAAMYGMRDCDVKEILFPNSNKQSRC